MYVSAFPSRQITRLGRMGRTNSQLRGASLRGMRRGMGDDGSIDWSSILTTSINDAAGVAKVALQPVPTVRTTYPGGGSQYVQYAPGAPSGMLSGSSLTSISSLFSSPMVLLFGAGLLFLVVSKRQ